MPIGQEQMNDIVQKVVKYEQGFMSNDEVEEFFQLLVDTGEAYAWQGSYGRMAEYLIKSGKVVAK